MNALDIVVITILGFSGLFAFARGFVREALSIGGWVAAGFATVYGLKYATPIAQQFISSVAIAKIVASLALFLGSLMIISLLTSFIAYRVKQSALSSVDRALGLLFGLARGVAIVCAAFLLFSWAFPADQDWPDWVREARTRPFLANGANWIKSLIPAEQRDQGAAAALEAATAAQKAQQQIQEADRLMRVLDQPAKAPEPPKSAAGYDKNERREMNSLFQSNQ